jgi:hypothetical protein
MVYRRGRSETGTFFEKRTSIIAPPHSSTPQKFVKIRVHLGVTKRDRKTMPTMQLIVAPGVRLGEHYLIKREFNSYFVDLKNKPMFESKYKRTKSVASLVLAVLHSIEGKKHQFQFSTTDLCSAVRFNDWAAVHNFLFLDHDINAPVRDGMNAIHCAASIGNIEALQLLLCSTQTPQLERRSRDNRRMTPLVLALDGKHTDAALMLLRAGADLDTHRTRRARAVTAGSRRASNPSTTSSASDLDVITNRSSSIRSSADHDDDDEEATLQHIRAHDPNPRLLMIAISQVLEAKLNTMDKEHVADLRRELAALYMCVTELQFEKKTQEFFTHHVAPVKEYFRNRKDDGKDDDDDDDDDEDVFNILSKAGIQNVDTLFPSLEEFLKRQKEFTERLSKLVRTWKPKTTLLAIGATIYEFRDMFEMYKRVRSAHVIREKIAIRCRMIARRENWELDLGQDLSALALSLPVRDPPYSIIVLELLRNTPESHAARKSLEQALFWVECILDTSFNDEISKNNKRKNEKKKNLSIQSPTSPHQRYVALSVLDEDGANLIRRGTSLSRRGVSFDSPITSPTTPAPRKSLSNGSIYDHPLDGGHMASSCIAAVLADDPEIWRHSRRRNTSRT